MITARKTNCIQWKNKRKSSFCVCVCKLRFTICKLCRSTLKVSNQREENFNQLQNKHSEYSYYQKESARLHSIKKYRKARVRAWFESVQSDSKTQIVVLLLSIVPPFFLGAVQSRLFFLERFRYECRLPYIATALICVREDEEINSVTRNNISGVYNEILKYET